MTFVISAGLVLLVLLLSIMLAKKKKLFADRFLILYLSFATLSQVYRYIEHTEPVNTSYWMLLGKGMYLLHAPIFYLYIVALTSPRKLQFKHYIFLFLPVAAYTIHFFYYYLRVFDTVTLSIQQGLLYVNGERSLSWLIFVVLFLIIEPIYLILFYRLLKRYKKRMLATVSNTDQIHFKWLNVLFLLWFLSSLILVPIGMLTVSRGWFSTDLLELLIELDGILFFFVVGFYGFRQTTIFTNLELAETLPQNTTTQNYERSGLSQQQAKIYQALLLTLMAEQKPYLDGNLTAGALSRLLGISVNHLSQVLNQEQRQNFFDFINRYRVEEVIQKMKDPNNRHLTLLALALDSGFNSKTSFNTIFKKVTHQTPSAYYKSIQK